MSAKVGVNVLRVFMIAFLIFGLAVNIRPVYALGTPQIVSINPGSPSPVGTNVSIRATVTWDSDFRSMRICFGSENWCQEDATPDITKNFDTKDLAPGTYQIIAEVAKVDQGWDTANKTYGSYQLTTASQQPEPTNVASSFSTRDVINIGGNVYVIVDRQRRHVPNPETLDALGISRSMINNRGYSDADLNTIPQGPDIPDVIRDPSGFRAFKDWIFPNLTPIGQPAPTQTQPPQQNGNVADSFSTKDIINIGGNIYVMVNGQRRHVPNPETLDALGISRDRINNRGYSDSELSSIPQGPDIPDVNRDYQGFMNFKNQYFPNTAPIKPGTQPGTTGNCPSAPAKVKIGDIAVVTDYQPNQLRIRRQPGLNQEIIGKIPVNEYVTIISGPRCVDGYRWWEVGYNGIGGWSAEVGSDGLYNLIPNTPPVLEQPTLEPSVVETDDPAPAQQTSNTSPFAPSESTGQDTEDPPWCSWGIIGQLLCAPVKAEGVNTTCHPQCVEEARIRRPDIIQWSTASMADLILSDAISDGSYFDHETGDLMQVRVRGDNENAQIGDIVIWTWGCNGVWAPVDANGNKLPGGHIGVAISNEYNKTIDIHDANSDWKCSRLDRKAVPINRSCMKFITQPNHVEGGTIKSSDTCSQYSGVRWLLCKWFGWGSK